jgi:hypothetical protein
MQASELLQTVRQHFLRHFGQPGEVLEVNQADGAENQEKLQLACFGDGHTHPWIYATCGASTEEMPDGRRVEGVVILSGDLSEEQIAGVHHLLVSFASFPTRKGIAIRFGDVVEARQEVRKFSSMDGVLFLPPLPVKQEARVLSVPNGPVVELIWLVPIFENEALYSMSTGIAPLMKLFADQNLNLTLPDRFPARLDDKAGPKRPGGPDGPRPSYDVAENSPERLKLVRKPRPAQKRRAPHRPVFDLPGQSRRKETDEDAGEVVEAYPPRAGRKPKPPFVKPRRKKEPIRFDLSHLNEPEPEDRLAPKRAKNQAPKEETKEERLKRLRAKAKEAVARSKEEKEKPQAAKPAATKPAPVKPPKLMRKRRSFRIRDPLDED